MPSLQTWKKNKDVLSCLMNMDWNCDTIPSLTNTRWRCTIISGGGSNHRSTPPKTQEKLQILQGQWLSLQSLRRINSVHAWDVEWRGGRARKIFKEFLDMLVFVNVSCTDRSVCSREGVIDNKDSNCIILLCKAFNQLCIRFGASNQFVMMDGSGNFCEQPSWHINLAP